MIQPNCKIENLNGIRFYEQDIMLDDHIYEDYAEILLNVDYCSPGFGFVIFPDGNIPFVSEDTECFIFRFGYRDVSVEYKSGTMTTTMVQYALSLFNKDDIDLHNISVRFKKDKRNVYMSINDVDILTSTDYSLPIEIFKYNIGIYSNAGNIIKSIQYKTYTPKFWSINMYNTIGGRIAFYANGFAFNDCNSNAEIEQYDIHLDTPGTYYLQYELSEQSDIHCYVFKSDSVITFDNQKNILDSNGSFVIDEPSCVNIKFVGTHGSVSNIILNQSKNSKYVRTYSDNDFLVNGSSIVVKKDIDTIKLIEWTAIINSYSDDQADDGMPSFAFCDGNYILNESLVKPNYEYTYKYDLVSKQLIVSCNMLNINETIVIDNNTDSFTLFSDVDALISQFIITKQDGSTINTITNSGNYIYVPLSRTSPLIITAVNENDSSEEPLDISSSYRVITTMNDDKTINKSLDEYVFTNVEREVFPVDSLSGYSLKTSHNISSKFGAVQQIICINADELDIDNFYRIKRIVNDGVESYNINDVEILLGDFDFAIIDSANIVVNVNNNSVEFDKDINISNYKYIVIDYLKDDSYCINPDFENGRYDIDVSTEKNISYYFKELKVGAEEEFTADTQYVIIDINNTNDSYLCIDGDQDRGGNQL